MKRFSHLVAALIAAVSIASLAQDKIIIRDAQVVGSNQRGVPIVLHDNADGTYSEQVFTTGGGGGGGGGGDASAANQVTQISQLPTSRGAKTGALSLSVVPNTDTAFPISAASLPLPSGAATSANQSTANTSLASIDTKLTSPLAVTGTFWQATQPVSGTFWQATQPVSGTFFQATQPVSLAALTATAAADANRLPVDERDSLALTPASLTATGTLFTQDMTGYRSISVQVTSAGTTCTITYETSDDNTNWLSASGIPSTASGSATQTTSTSAQSIQFPRKGKFFRARVSTYTSGTVTVVATLSTAPVTAFGSSISTSGLGTHGSAITGGPNRMGGRALTANYAAVTTGQTADLVTTLVGAVVQKPYSIPEADWSYVAASGGISNSTTAVTIAAAAGAGLRNYITGIQLSSDTLGAATEIAVRDGAAGTVIWRAKLTTAGVSGGDTFMFPSPLKSTANTLLEVVTLTASVTGGVYFNAQGYIAP